MSTVNETEATRQSPVVDARRADTSKTRNIGVLRNVLEPVAQTATAIAIVVAIYQFIEARQDRRTDATLNLAARFDDEQGQVGRSKHLLEQQWWAHESELEKLRSLTGDGAVAEPQLRAFVKEVILDQSGARRGEMRAAVSDVTKYFDQIGLCVSENRCDRRLAADYFCGYASNFHRLFDPTIRNIRQNFGSAALGQNFTKFLESECASSSG
jgi:hypothetical protein